MIRVAPRTPVPAEHVLETRLEAPAAPVETTLLDFASETTPLVSVLAPRSIVLRPEAEPEPEPTAKPEPASEAAATPEPAEATRPNNPEGAATAPGPAIDIPLTIDPHYYEAKELDVQPKPLHDINVDPPPEYEGQNRTGYVVLEMRIEEDGRMSDLKVAEVYPEGYDAFGRQALAGFRGAEFTPARRQGQQVKSLFRVKVTFDLEGEAQ